MKSTKFKQNRPAYRPLPTPALIAVWKDPPEHMESCAKLHTLLLVWRDVVLMETYFGRKCVSLEQALSWQSQACRRMGLPPPIAVLNELDLADL